MRQDPVLTVVLIILQIYMYLKVHVLAQNHCRISGWQQ